MFTILTSLTGTFLTVCFIIGIHELGHFLAAKLCGIKVLRFSIGFGKTLFRWYDKTGTEYAITMFPLGGYVRLLDENETPVSEADKHLAFNNQSIPKRLSVVCAGPLFNLIFAFLTYWIVFVIGLTTFVPTIGEIIPVSISSQAGLKVGQEITKINGKQTRDWMDVTIAIFSRIGDQGKMEITVKDPKINSTKIYQLNLENWKLDKLNPDPIESLGIIPFEPKTPAIIGEILENSPAKTQLKLQDRILAINDQPVQDWPSMTEMIKQHPDQTISIKIKRNGKIITKQIALGYKRNWLLQKEGFLGVISTWQTPDELINKNKYSPLGAIIRSYQEVVQFIHLNFLVIGKLITGDISVQSIAGPVSILAGAGVALNLGFVVFLSFLGFISSSIAAVNILPIPGLDGSYVVYFLIESIIKRPISPKIRILLYRLGILTILFILAQGLVNDLLRLIQ